MPPNKEWVMDTGQSLETEGMIAVGTNAHQYLTFVLAGEEYGLDILRIQEIRAWDTVTPIPNTPPYLKGVINLRGTIVPIIDLRERFSLDLLPYGPTTVVIVLRAVSESGERIMGVVVDAVSDVYSMIDEHMKRPPDFSGVISSKYVRGLATVDDHMVIVLDIDKLLNADELAALDSVTE